MQLQFFRYKKCNVCATLSEMFQRMTRNRKRNPSFRAAKRGISGEAMTGPKDSFGGELTRRFALLYGRSFHSNILYHFQLVSFLFTVF